MKTLKHYIRNRREQKLRLKIAKAVLASRVSERTLDIPNFSDYFNDIYDFIQSPQDRIENCRVQHGMDEEFLAWAKEYFSSDDKRYTRLPYRDLYDAFLEYSPEQRKYYTIIMFKKRIQSYCTWKGYKFSVNKDAGIEYIIIN